MSGAYGFGAILFGIALLVGLFAERPVAGLAPNEFIAVAMLGAAALLMTGSAANEFRRGFAEGSRALAIWALVFAGLLTAYARRDEFGLVLDRLIGEIDPGRTVVTQSGEVVVARRADGSFTLAGRVNGTSSRFIFDTGASTVVLTAESAAEAGFHARALSYSVPVFTANGRTLAAPVTVERIEIGPIVQRRIQALVAKPGVLRENLLGMTFLDRLPSYEVRGNRLILRTGAQDASTR